MTSRVQVIFRALAVGAVVLAGGCLASEPAVAAASGQPQNSWSTGTGSPVDTTPPAAPTIGPMTMPLSTSLDKEISFSGEPGGSFECRINEGAWEHCVPLWVATFPGPGLHSFEIRQTDDAGNTGPAARGSWGVWAGPPSTPVIDSAPSGVVRSTRAEVRFTAGPVGTPVCRLNDGDWQLCDGVWRASNLGQGPQTLWVGQRNLEVGKDAGPLVGVQWTIDTIAPRLADKVRARVKGKAKRGKARRWVLTSRYNRKLEKPATLEFSLARTKPKLKAAPVKARSRKWAPKLTVRLKKKPAWVRVLDRAGNASAWVRVR